MFHSNKPTEIGLVSSTKAFVTNPPKMPLDYAPRDLGLDRIGCSVFLRDHTSTTEWETFQQLYDRAVKLDPKIFDHSLQVTLCHMVRAGTFEKKCLGTGHRTLYRRCIEIRRKERAKYERKVTQRDW